MYSKTKAALIRQLAFSLTILGLLVACENPGSAGDGFVTETEVRIDTVLIQNFQTESVSPYLGKRTYSATGSFSDPLFGDIETFLFFKPSITKLSSNDSLFNRATFNLRINLLESAYGDTSTIGSYSVYRVNDLWKGTSFKGDMDITYGTEVIGQFTDADVDTAGYLEFELGGSWKDDFIDFYNDSSSTRTIDYRDTEFGLAIVPDAGINKIVYANMGISEVIAYDADADTSSHTILDWAYDFTKGTEAQATNRFHVYNTYDNYLKFNLQEIAEQLDNKNFVRAELVFPEDTLALSNTLGPNEVRTMAPGLIMKVGPLDDIAYTFGFSSVGPNENGIFSDGKYVFRATESLNDNLFGDEDFTEVYIVPYASNGVLGFTSLYGPGAPADLAPKLIIYSLEKGE